jgi:hypothetical protein
LIDRILNEIHELHTLKLLIDGENRLSSKTPAYNAGVKKSNQIKSLNRLPERIKFIQYKGFVIRKSVDALVFNTDASSDSDEDDDGGF